MSSKYDLDRLTQAFKDFGERMGDMPAYPSYEESEESEESDDGKYMELGGVKMQMPVSSERQYGDAIRDGDEDKLRYDLVSPIFKKRLAAWTTLGAKKYSARNWEKGIPLHRYVASMVRHMEKFLASEHDESHLVACAWNIMAFIHTEQKILDEELPEILLTAGIHQKYSEEEYEEWLHSAIGRGEHDDEWSQKE